LPTQVNQRRKESQKKNEGITRAVWFFAFIGSRERYATM
jgi:hypothetical protein